MHLCYRQIDKHILLGVTAGTSESSATQGRTGEVPPVTTGVQVAPILSHFFNMLATVKSQIVDTGIR